MSFRLAPMDGLNRALTYLLLPLPLALLLLSPGRVLWPAATLVLLAYLSILLWFRPTRFVLHADALEVVWPLRRERLPLSGITRAQVIDGNPGLKAELGYAFRIGAGGLFGGFGLLKTQRRGMMRFYISRIRDYVLLDRGDERAWLITPAEHRRFLRALAERGVKVASGPAR